MEKNISHVDLFKFTEKVFLKLGFHPENARLATDVLISADLRGIDSHGVARLPGYIKLLEKKRANPNPHLQVEHETPSTATLDGDKGLGLITGPHAMLLAIKKAKNAGTGWVAVNNSNHFGIAAYHAMLALKYNMIGISMTNASPLVAPTHSIERLLGTNPICFAAPALNEAPFVMDMATTTAANGKLEVLQRKNQPVPTGWAQDEQGYDTNDPYILEKKGAMKPLGGEHASHKGYCLGSMVDILCAVLSGANYGPWVPPFVAFLDPGDEQVGKGIGHFMGAIRIDAFRPEEHFKKHMDKWIQRFRNSKTFNGLHHVLIPGDPERLTEEHRKAKGIPVLPKIWNQLKDISKMFDVPFDC
jgi:LDH2 family malate/lactate/ureidoglycolate dehydrogenase